MAIKYVSGRTRELKVGLSSYSEGKPSLQVTGNVGVGTTNPLSLANPSNTSVISAGIVTANKLYGDVVATGVGITNLYVAGVSTFVGLSTFRDDVVFQGNIEAQSMTWDASENDLEFTDLARAKFGNSDDLEIWHGSGNNSHIKNSTNDLKIRSDSLILKRADDTESYLKATVNSDVKIYYNGNEKFATTGLGVTVLGNTETQTLHVTSGISTFDGDLYVADNIRHKGDTDTYIEFTGDQIRLIAGGKPLIHAEEGTIDTVVINDGGNDLDFRVEGLNDNSLIFSDGDTDRVGIGTSAPTAKLDVNGTLNVVGVTTHQQDVYFPGAAYNIQWDQATSKFKFDDSAQLVFGSASGGDMKLFHQSGDSTIRNETGQFRIAGNDIRLQSQNHSEDYILCTDGGAVQLFYNDNERLATTGIGITIVGVGSTAYIEGPDNIIIDPHPYGVGTTSGSVHIKGDLYVDGTEFIIDVDKIELGDFQIGIATTAGTNVLLDGAGIGIGSTGIRKYITWNNATNALMSSENWNIASGKHYEINGVDVLTSDTLQLLGTGAQVHAPSSNILTLKTNGAERLRIDATGNLGIGTATPTDPANAANTSVTSAGIVTANQYYGTFLGSIPGFSTVFSSGQGSFSATPGSPHTIDTFAFASHDYEIAEYTLHFVHANGLQAQKTLVIQNNSTAYSNEYGILYDSELLVSVGATISGGNVNITATPEAGISGVTTFRWRREVQT